MRIFTKIICLLLVALMTVPLFSCASDTGNNANTTTTPSDNASEAEETSRENKFKGFDYKESEFRIYTSTNIASPGMGNSNFMIEGIENPGSDIVSNAVFNRNLETEDLLNIRLKFTRVDNPYTEVSNDIKKLHTTGYDTYDLIINDLFPIAGLSVSGYFCNTLSNETDNYFDFSQKYWYSDYMSDVTLYEGYQFLLAGDYFADVLRSAHCLIYNKDMYNDIYHDPDQLYTIVSNYEWTQEKFQQIISENYKDMNGHDVDKEDRFGLIVCDMWGSMIPMITSAGCDYFKRDEEGWPEITIYNNRTIDLVDSLYKIYYNEGTSYSLFTDDELLTAFMNGRALIVGYQRLGSLENLRSRDCNIGVIPYPMLYLSDHKYTTSSHDTTEIGVIPINAKKNFAFISNCIEALSCETSDIVVPEYYENSLKIKYSNDELAAQMIDIIHDNFGNTFQLAYDASFGNCFKGVIFDTVNSKTNKLASSAKKKMNIANTNLKNMKKTFQNNVINSQN